MTEPDWSQFPAGGRQATLRRALQRLWELHPGPITIVETGTTRDATPEGRQGDGWSTLAFAWYCSQVEGRVWSVDVSQESLEACWQVIGEEYDPVARWVKDDAAHWLAIYPFRHSSFGPIHLLYLDSLDYAPGHEAESERHHLAEAQAALPALAPTCLILIDDTRAAGNDFTGKGKLAIPFLWENGFRLEWCEGGQALMSRGATQ